MGLQWIEKEFETLDLPNVRRERQAKMIVEQLSSMANSTPDACQGNTALEATYRFADNDSVSPDAILQAHRQARKRRRAIGGWMCFKVASRSRVRIRKPTTFMRPTVNRIFTSRFLKSKAKRRIMISSCAAARTDSCWQAMTTPK